MDIILLYYGHRARHLQLYVHRNIRSMIIYILKHTLLEVTKPYYERFRGIFIQIKNIHFNDNI